jgi:hypothetical protein
MILIEYVGVMFYTLLIFELGMGVGEFVKRWVYIRNFTLCTSRSSAQKVGLPHFKLDTPGTITDDTKRDLT